MFKQTKYKVLYAAVMNGEPVWNELDVKRITLGVMGVEKAEVEDESKPEGEYREILIDGISAFARESTTMYDKDGTLLFGGDVVKVPIATSTLEIEPGKSYSAEEIEAAKVVKEVLAPIVWINGAYCLCLRGWENPIYLTQQNVRQMEKVGNMYQHSTILEEPADESFFENTEGSEN